MYIHELRDWPGSIGTRNAEQVRPSIARRLGVDTGELKPAERHVEGVVEMMLDPTRHYDQPLSAERLFAWHALLFSTGPSVLSVKYI